MAGLTLIPLTDKIFIVDTSTKGRFPLAYGFLILGTDTMSGNICRIQDSIFPIVSCLAYLSTILSRIS